VALRISPIMLLILPLYSAAFAERCTHFIGVRSKEMTRQGLLVHAARRTIYRR
jgi:hypothetical protein